MNIDLARRQMIEQQVRAWDVLDPAVLDVLGAVPRERFVPAAYAALAFADTEIPIGHGEAMMTPTVEGRLLQSLGIGDGDRILEIGTGTGFLAACIARLGARVTSIDIHEDFIRQATRNLDAVGIDGVDIVKMDAMQSLPEGPFDAIAVTGSLHAFDARFVEALTIGGQLFVVVGDEPVMEARRVVRTTGTEWISETLFETRLKPLVHAAAPPAFRF